MKLTKWLKDKLGINSIKAELNAQSYRIKSIENLVKVGSDLNFKTPSWIVVCLKGDKQDIVRFFELPDIEIKYMFETLKELEHRYHCEAVFDAPPYIKREYLRF